MLCSLSSDITSYYLVNMADIKPIGKALFLREEELRRGIEMLFSRIVFYQRGRHNFG